MAVTINGVACDELVDGYGEELDESGPRGSKYYLCDWGSRYTVANGLLGFVTVTGGTTITFTSPTAHPESSNMFARSVRIKGVGRPSQGSVNIAYPKAVVMADFARPTFNMSGTQDPGGTHSIDTATPLIYATQEIDEGGEFVTLPGSSLVFDSGTKIQEDGSLFVPHDEIIITFHRFPYFPRSTSSLKGKTNASTFLGCDPEKLLYHGQKVRDSFLSDGTFTHEVTRHWSYRQVEWNKRLLPDGSGWGYYKYSSSGARVFPTADFSDLIPTAYQA